MIKGLLLLLVVAAAVIYLSTEGGSEAYRELSDSVGNWFIDTFGQKD